MRPKTRKWLFLIASFAVLFAASTRIKPLDAQREEYHLVLPPLPDEMAPSMLYSPLLAVGRAPIVDILWLRATRLKEEGRYFDALQLSKRICELQPKFPDVWAFQAWNMSYNISVTLQSPEERWRWVRNGYELLRDKGIPLNPHSTQLYRELAWILFHKVGDFMDDWHFYYKNEFAMIMEDILGEPPEGYVRPGRSRGDFYRNYDYQSLADAPQRFDDLLVDDKVKAFADLVATYGFNISEPDVFLGLLEGARADQVQMPDTPEHEQLDRMRAFLAVFNDPKNAQAKRRIEAFWRAKRLREEVKLDPSRIVELEKAFGISLDYRLAETHAFYWANLGLEMGTDKRTAIDTHRLNTNRIEFYCLQKMFHRGWLTMSKNAQFGEPPMLGPDMRVVPVLQQVFKDSSKKYLKNEHTDKAISENFRPGYVGFMRSAILRFHELGRNEEGRALFDDVREQFPDPMYDKGYEHFLFAQVQEDLKNQDYQKVLSRMQAMLTRGLNSYAFDDDERAAQYILRAKEVYDQYKKEQVSERWSLPSFNDVVTISAHSLGGRMYRSSYENLCRKLNIEPLPERTAPAQQQGTDK